MKFRLLAALAAAGALLATSGGACDRAVRQHPLTLEPMVFEFHQAIRDRHITEAAAYMAPRHRDAFLKSWAHADRIAQVHELEVTSQRKTDDMEYAHIEALMRYLLVDSLVERQHVLVEIWKGEGKSWVLDSVVEAPPELRDQPAPPPPDPPAPGPEPTGGGFGGGQ